MTENKKTETKETKAQESVYERLSKVDVTPFIEKKNGLNYLSWAKAWGLVKSIYPDANYKFREYPYFEQTADGNYQPCGTRDYLRTEYGVEVEAIVTIQGQTYSSKLYVMDFKNRALDPNKVTLFEINKTQMRALTKALAFAGLGLNIYAGEDLPSGADDTPTKISKAQLLKKKIANAQRFEVQYGGGKEKLVDVVSWEKSGDKQAHMFIETWVKKDKKNLAAYEFIVANGLYTVKG